MSFGSFCIQGGVSEKENVQGIRIVNESLKEYRASKLEQERFRDLLNLLPESGERVLDVGTRDGFYAKALTRHFKQVVALDIVPPAFSHPHIWTINADACRLPFVDGSFDLVFCTEVLEHIPPERLNDICRELKRVCRKFLLIGVPYRQDIRVGRCTCRSCGKISPPWGHYNRFDETCLEAMFRPCQKIRVSFVGESKDRTNGLTRFLYDCAGNPFGYYHEDVSCIHCGQPLIQAPPRNLLQRVFTRLGFLVQKVQDSLSPRSSHPEWIHILFRASE
ncbi:MAG: class I SAM-dependent methyltransferase [Lentisphaerae bacterium]|nr:MAG: class I SAM-dependent methyltransferase [Lentisphaerota bacterium]